MLRALEANKLAAAAVPCPASDSDEKPVGAVCTLDPGWSYEEACLEWHVQQLCDDGYTEAAKEFPLAAAASPEDFFVHASCVEDPGGYCRDCSDGVAKDRAAAAARQFGLG